MMAGRRSGRKIRPRTGGRARPTDRAGVVIRSDVVKIGGLQRNDTVSHDDIPSGCSRNSPRPTSGEDMIALHPAVATDENVGGCRILTPIVAIAKILHRDTTAKHGNPES